MNTNKTNINHRLLEVNQVKNNLKEINRKNKNDLENHRKTIHKTIVDNKNQGNTRNANIRIDSIRNVNTRNVNTRSVNTRNAYISDVNTGYARDDKSNHIKIRPSYIKNISISKSSAIQVYLILWLLVMIIIGITYNRLEIHMVADQIMKEGIDYDSFRDMKISKSVINKIKVELNQETKQETDQETKQEINQETKQETNQETNQEINKEYNKEINQEYRKENIVNRLTLTMMTNKFTISKSKLLSKKNTNQLYKILSNNASFKELNKYYYAIMNDIKCFPVETLENGKPCVTFTDTWNAYRSYGGVRRHEGTDLMAIDNVRGKHAILSMTDGVVEKIGWLEQGGYRIGVRGDSGAYYYYAHLDSYGKDLKQGDKIKAGDFLGYMGDSGYGKEGTVGKFDVHLHMGIYVDAPFGEMSINPYSILLYLESK